MDVRSDGSLIQTRNTKGESMSPGIPILFALLLTLISGSAEGGLRTDPVALLRQTLRYWRKIYKTYYEEVALGYCWADYLLQISDELSTNLSAALPATGDRSNTTTGATKSQRNPFPENVMADATRLRETWDEHLRKKRSGTKARSAISKFIKDPNGRRILSRSTIIQKRKERTMNKAGRDTITNNAEESDKIDGKRITSMIESHIERRRRRRRLSQAPKLFHEELGLAQDCEFSSHGTRSRSINPTPNPEDDDKVRWRSSWDLEEDIHRKVLRPATDDDRHGSYGPRSFSLRVSRDRRRKSLVGGRRFPFRPYIPSSRGRNSRVSEPLCDPEPPEDRGRTKRDLEGHRILLYNGGSSSKALSRLQFRRVNVGSLRCTGVVKLMDSQENSSLDPARVINSRMARRRKPEKLSRDSLRSPRSRTVGAERSPLELRESGREAIKRDLSRSVMDGDDARKQPHRRSRREKRSRGGGNVLPTRRTIHHEKEEDSLLSSRQPRKNRRLFIVTRTSTRVSRRRDDRIRAAKDATPLRRIKRFTMDYRDNATIGSIRDSNVPSGQDQRPFLVRPRSLASSIRTFIIGVLRTLGMFVQVGRQIMDIVESNAILACTVEYLWIKIDRWIDA